MAKITALRIASCALTVLSLQACSSDDDHKPAATAPVSTTAVTFPESSAADLKSTLDGIVSAGVAPGVSLTVQHPSYPAWSGASGTADIGTHAPLTAEARFRAGSMLKVSIATAVLQLVEKGTLSLDATLPKLLPADVAARIPNANAITLAMLLGHTSGLAEFDDAAFDEMVARDPKHVWAFDFLLGRAVALPPVFAPGQGWSYTNTGYLLLGKILDQASGQPWRETLRSQVFARAHMEQTELPEEGNALCSGCSRGYLPMNDQLVDVTEVDPSMAGPAGGDALITTTQDLVKLVAALASGKMFDDPKTLDRMLAFADAPIPEEAQTGYGLGIARFQIGETQLIGHLGGTAGFHGFVLVHPGSGIVASGYMNQNGDAGAFYGPVIEAISRVK